MSIANTHGETTLVAKLNTQGEQCMNALLTRDEAILAAKLNVRGKAAYERPATHAAKLRRTS